MQFKEIKSQALNWNFHLKYFNFAGIYDWTPIRSTRNDSTRFHQRASEDFWCCVLNLDPCFNAHRQLPPTSEVSHEWSCRSKGFWGSVLVLPWKATESVVFASLFKHCRIVHSQFLFLQMSFHVGCVAGGIMRHGLLSLTWAHREHWTLFSGQAGVAKWELCQPIMAGCHWKHCVVFVVKVLIPKIQAGVSACDE